MFIQFYQVCDYSLQKTKQLTEKYYKYKHFVPKLFAENEFSQSYCTCYFWNNMQVYIFYIVILMYIHLDLRFRSTFQIVDFTPTKKTIF